MLLGTCSCAVVWCVLWALSGLRQAAAVAAWHLSVCLGCGRRHACLACLVAPLGAPRLVRSGRFRCSGRLYRRRGAFLHPGGLHPRLYWVAARGTRRPAENRAHCACCWPPPRQVRWASSALYPFGAPRWGCPWRVPRATVLGCVRCGGWPVWTLSLTRPVSCTVRPSTGDPAGAPGLFRVDANTPPCGSEDAEPGSRACVRVLVRPGRVGRAGLPGGFWCASPFPLAASSFCFVWPPPGWVCAGLGPLFARRLLFCFFSFLFLRCFFPCAPFVSCFLWFPSPGALGLGALCCLFCWPRASWLSVRSRFLCVAWPLATLRWVPPPHPLSLAVAAARCCLALFFFSCLRTLVSAFLCFPAPAPGLGAGVRLLCSALRALCCSFFAPRFFPHSRLFCVPWLAAGCCPPPPPLLCLAVFVVFARCLGFFFLSPLVRPRCLRLCLVSRPGCPGPWLCVLFVFLGLPLPGSPCAPASFVSPTWPWAAPSWLLPPPPPLLCLPVFVAPARCLGFFFLPLCAPIVSGLLWFLAPGALGLGAVHCLLCWPSASRLSLRSRLIRAFRLAVGCSLVVAAPPPHLCLAVFVAAARCCVPCAVLCCVSLGAVLRRAAARCAAPCCALVCCVALLRRFGAAACCAMPSGAARRPGALCIAALCFAVFPHAVCSVLSVFCRGVVVRAVVCRSALCCVCPRGAVLCVLCPLYSVRCCASLCWCACLFCSCGACCCWRLVLWCGAVCCAVSSGVLWCGAGSGGPWLSAGGSFRCRCPCLTGWSAFLWLLWCAVVPCFPLMCAVVLCCRVVLCCYVLLSCCGAVGACFAPLWPVVLCCVVLLVGCAVFCLVVVSACCGALSLVLCVPCLLRSVRCGALLCWLWCPASLCCVLWRCAVVWCCAVVLCCRFAVLFVFALPSCGLSCGAVLCCVVLLVVRAVFCPVVAFVCCCALSLPAGTHKKHQLSYMSPCVGGGVVAGLPWWLRCPELGAAHVPPAAKGRRKRRGWGTGGRGRYMVKKRA